MNGQLRREKIIDILSRSDKPVSGVALAKQLDVSRQVIVQDIALIRAADYDIYSTNRGYVIKSEKEHTRIVKVKHAESDVETELNAIVDMGGWLMTCLYIIKYMVSLRLTLTFIQDVT